MATNGAAKRWSTRRGWTGYRFGPGKQIHDLVSVGSDLYLTPELHTALQGIGGAFNTRDEYIGQTLQEQNPASTIATLWPCRVTSRPLNAAAETAIQRIQAEQWPQSHPSRIDIRLDYRWQSLPHLDSMMFLAPLLACRLALRLDKAAQEPSLCASAAWRPRPAVGPSWQFSRPLLVCS